MIFKYKNKSLVSNLNDWATKNPLNQEELNQTVLRESIFFIKENPVTVEEKEEKTKKEENYTDIENILIEKNDKDETTGLKAIIDNPKFDPEKLNLDSRVIFKFLKKADLAGNLVFIDSFYIYQGSSIMEKRYRLFLFFGKEGISHLISTNKFSNSWLHSIKKENII